jgi:hypothetical protein
MVLLSAIYAGIYVLCAVHEGPRWARLFAGVAVTGLLSAGLGACVVLPTMEFKPYSNLAELTYAHFVSLSVAPQSFVQLLFPYIMGADSLTYHAVPYFGADQLAVAAMYMGILPLMLAVAGLVLWRRLRVVRFAAISAGVAALLSFGGYTPLGRILFRMPIYNFFRDHRIHLVFLAFFVAMLAGVFAGNLERLDDRRRRRLAVAIPLGFVAVAAIVLIKIRAILASMDPSINPLDGMWVVRLHQSMRFGNRDMLIAILTLMVSGFVFRRWTQRPGSRMIAQVAIVVVVADLLWFGATDQPHFAPGGPSVVEQAANDAAVQAAHGEPFRVLSLDRDHPYLHPNLNEITGLDHIFGYSALIPGRYADLLQADEVGDNPWRETVTNNLILSLLNTRFLFARDEQWKSLGNVFADQGKAETSTSENFSEPSIISGSVINLHAGRDFEEEQEFVCERPPCGFKVRGLSLRRNSIYELSFGVSSTDMRNPSLDVWFMNPAHWRPREMFRVSNVLITGKPRMWIFTYVTGDQDEAVDLRFATGSSSRIRLAGLHFGRVGTLPKANPYREIARSGNIVVLENQNALPRAFFVSRVTPVGDYNEARIRLWDPVQPFDPKREALVEAVPANVHPTALSVGTVKRIEYRPNRTALDVSCPASCYLVLSDLYLPGWEARIDGQSAHIYVTDAVVRGLFVSAGEHHVEFVYRPKSVIIGVVTSLLTCLVMGAMVWRPRMPNRL